MALSYVGGTSGTGTGASYTVSLSGTLTGGSGSSPQAGDIVLVAAGHGATTVSAPAVSGNNNGAYSTAGGTTRANSTYDTNFGLFYKVQGGTVDTQLTITRTNNTTYGGAVAIHVWRGQDTTAPFNVTGTLATVTTGSRGNPPSVTPTVDGCVVIGCGSGMQTSSGSAFTAPAELTDHAISVKGDGSTSDCGTWMASVAGTNGVAKDPSAWTGGTTSSSCSAVGQTIVLAPYVEPPPAPGTYYGAASDTVTGVSVNAGDLIAVFYTYWGTLGTNSCSDNASGGTNTYTEVGGAGYYNGNGASGTCFYAVAKATETLTITMPLPGGISGGALIVHVYPGYDGTLDGSSYKADTADTAHTTNALTTTNANDLLVSFYFHDSSSNNTFTENGQGFTKRQQISSSGATEYQTTFDREVTSTSTYNDAVTSSASMMTGSLIVAFKKSTGSSYDPTKMFLAM